MAAIRSFTEPIVLLLGGRDKNLPWEELAPWSASAWSMWCSSAKRPKRSHRL